MEKITCDFCGYESNIVGEFDECTSCNSMFCKNCGDLNDYLCEDCIDDIIKNNETKTYIQLSEKYITNVEIDNDNETGCYNINCFGESRIQCDECNISKRGLNGELINVEQIRDLIITK